MLYKPTAAFVPASAQIGVMRNVDPLGRISIPSEALRQILGIRNDHKGDERAVEIVLYKDGVFLRRPSTKEA